jgi:hypothetical protein
LCAAFAGHLLVLIAAVTDSAPPTTAVVAAIACSIIAVVALTQLAPPDRRAQRAVTPLIGGYGVAAAITLGGIVPRLPWWMSTAGFGAAAALGAACVAMVWHRSMGARLPRPLTMAPRVAAIALVVQALLQRWAASATSPSMSFRVAIFLSFAALVVALASLSIIALRVRSRWAVAGLVAWTVGWVANTADVSALVVWSLGGPFPTGLHQLTQLDAELIQIVATVGGLGIGGALVTAIRDARFRHSAVVLLAGYAVFGLIAAVAEHRIELATDFPSITALRSHRDLADAIAAFALGGVLWLYWRRVAASYVSDPYEAGGEKPDERPDS